MPKVLDMATATANFEAAQKRLKAVETEIIKAGSRATREDHHERTKAVQAMTKAKSDLADAKLQAQLDEHKQKVEAGRAREREENETREALVGRRSADEYLAGLAAGKIGLCKPNHPAALARFAEVEAAERAVQAAAIDRARATGSQSRTAAAKPKPRPKGNSKPKPKPRPKGKPCPTI
jgi:hypothetical protein